MILWRAGLRCSEALALEHSDMRETGRSMVLRVREPKGYHRKRNPSDPREVGIDPQAAEIVHAWQVMGGTDGRVFRTQTGAPLQTSYVRQFLPRLARSAGIKRRVHAHCLRHTFARELYDEGVGVMEIMRALGHRSVGTTMTYLQSIGATEVVAITTERSWE